MMGKACHIVKWKIWCATKTLLPGITLLKWSQAKCNQTWILTFCVLLNTRALAITLSYTQINSLPSVKYWDNHRVWHTIWLLEYDLTKRKRTQPNSDSEIYDLACKREFDKLLFCILASTAKAVYTYIILLVIEATSCGRLLRTNYTNLLGHLIF